jgi:hypothetical protein
LAEDQQNGQRHRDAARWWDQLGSVMGAAGELGEAIAQRNLDLWNRVASNLTRSRYSGEDMAEDAAQAVTTAVRNVRDVWTVVTYPATRDAAPALPSRSLFLQPDPSSPPTVERPLWGYMVSEDVPAIPVPQSVWDAKSIVSIRLGGPDDGTSTRLEALLKAQYSAAEQTVSLVPQDVPYLTEVAPLQPGVYQGVVYVDADTTPRAISQLWIVVEPEPD